MNKKQSVITEAEIKKMQEQVKKDFNSLPEHLKKMNIFMSNDLVKSGQDFTLYQKRLLAYVMGLITKEDREKNEKEFINKTFTIQMNNFEKMFNIKENNSNVYLRLKEACEGFLTTRSVLIDKKTNSETLFVWLQEITYKKEKNEYGDVKSRIYIKFSDIVYKHLAKLSSCYSSYNVFLSHNFKSTYTIRTFELLQTVKNVKGKNKNTLEMDFNDFKIALGILKKSYAYPAVVRAKVLDIVKTELNNKLGLGFEYEIKRDKSKNSKFSVILKAKKNNDNLLTEWSKDNGNNDQSDGNDNNGELPF